MIFLGSIKNSTPLCIYRFLKMDSLMKACRFRIGQHKSWLIAMGLLVSGATPGSAQIESFNIHDTTVNVCKGNFYDSQGPGDIYLNDENHTFTINSGGVITLSFDTFCVESLFDSIRFYDGPDTLSPQIGPAYSGFTQPPPVVASSGWLTINFRSDGNAQYCGWEAYWTTVVPAPIPPVMTVSPLPACNASTIDLVFSSPVRCDSVSPSDFSISGPSVVSVNQALPLNCSNDSTTAIQLELDQPLDENCTYYIDYDLELLDRCDSVWQFVVSTNFLLSTCPANVTIAVGNDSICAGSCTDIEAVLSSCLTYNYTWNQGLPSTAGPFTVCPIVTTDYTVVVQDIGGTGPPDSVTATIYVIDPQISDSDTTVCQSDTAFNVQAMPSGGVWRGPGIIDSVAGTFDPDTSGPGLHSILYLLDGLCADTLMINVKEMDAGLDEAACPGAPAFMVSGFSPPGGIWSGDSIQSNGLFNPDTNGVYTITYSFNGCSEDKLVYVDNIAGPTQMDTVCQSLPPYDIPITPFGGRWYGTGITDSVYGTFDPDMAGGGLHELLYQLNGCVDTVQIFVHEIDVGYWVKGTCPLQAPFIISPPGTPSGGWWNGQGIVDSITGFYDPYVFNGSNGNDTLVYELPNGCTDTLVMWIYQTKIGVDTLLFCIGDDSIRLNWASVKRAPGGGDWSGSGLVGSSNDYFKPSAAGAGVHTLVYTANDCSDSIIMIVYPELNELDTLMCSSQAPFVIQQVPPGGYWWADGPGVVDDETGLYDPGLALQDTQYVYFTTPAGCKDSVQIAVYQFEEAQITGLDTLYCFENEDYSFSYVPLDAEFTGPVNGTVFNPDSVGEGLHTLTVTHGVGACKTQDTIQITVLPQLTSVLTATEDTICNGEGVTLTVDASGGVPGVLYSYAWSHGLFPINTNAVDPQETTTYTVTTSDGCSDDAVDSITIVIAEQFSVSIETSTISCYGEEGFATANVNGTSTYSYLWTSSTVQTGDSIIGIAGDSYTVNIIDDNSGCEFDTLIKIPNYSIVNAMFSISPSVECVSFDQKDLLTLIDLSNHVDNGYWDFGNGDITPYVLGQNPNPSFESAGYYTVELTAYNEGGCMDVFALDICIYDPLDLFVAEAFSPNGDGANDVLFVRGNAVVELDFRVYNRWGQKVFESHDVNHGWDGTFNGKLLNSEVFVYYVYATTKYGETIEIKGDVSLVR